MDVHAAGMHVKNQATDAFSGLRASEEASLSPASPDYCVQSACTS